MEGEPNPDFTATYTGFKNGEDETVLKVLPKFVCEADENSAPGTYTILAEEAQSANYNITYEVGTLTVTEAQPVTVTANSYTREYGEENPVLEYTTDGAQLNGAPELSCEATAVSPVGTYDIVVGKGSVTNRNDTYVNGTLTITPATLTVGVKDAVIEQGDELPVFELTYLGWKNGDDVSVLTALPVAATAATSDSPIGDYEISISGGEAQNYVFDYVAGKLTVKESSGINSLTADGDGVFDVYTVSGVKVRSRVTTLDALPNGVYIVKGRTARKVEILRK
jgi:hypothetical protein